MMTTTAALYWAALTHQWDQIVSTMHEVQQQHTSGSILSDATKEEAIITVKSVKDSETTTTTTLIAVRGENTCTFRHEGDIEIASELFNQLLAALCRGA